MIARSRSVATGCWNSTPGIPSTAATDASTALRIAQSLARLEIGRTVRAVAGLAGGGAVADRRGIFHQPNHPGRTRAGDRSARRRSAPGSVDADPRQIL